MKIDLRDGELLLAGQQTLRLVQARATRIRCTAGVLWLTVTGDPADIVLHAGQSYLVRSDGRVVIESQGEGRLRLEGPDKAAWLWPKVTKYFGWEPACRQNGLLQLCQEHP